MTTCDIGNFYIPPVIFFRRSNIVGIYLS